MLDGLSAPEVGTEENQLWTELVQEVVQAAIFPEDLGSGRTSYSIMLELREVTDPSRNTRTGRKTTLAFGMEEKDITAYARLLGRKVHLGQHLSRTTLEREELLLRLQKLEGDLAESKRKVTYLNDSLHQVIQGSRDTL